MTTKSRPLQWYHSQVNLIKPDGPLIVSINKATAPILNNKNKYDIKLCTSSLPISLTYSLTFSVLINSMNLQVDNKIIMLVSREIQ
jgi:hypothetical protein